MPLITCPDCSREISDLAASCIHCGRPLSPKEATKPIQPLPLPSRENSPGVSLNRGVVSNPPALSAARPGSGGNVAAALASFFIAGLGQIAQGRPRAGAGFFLGAVLSAVFGLTLGLGVAAFLLTGAIAIWSAIDAAVWDGRR